MSAFEGANAPKMRMFFWRIAQNGTERDFVRKGFRDVPCGSVANTADEPSTPRQKAGGPPTPQQGHFFVKYRT